MKPAHQLARPHSMWFSQTSDIVMIVWPKGVDFKRQPRHETTTVDRRLGLGQLSEWGKSFVLPFSAITHFDGLIRLIGGRRRYMLFAEGREGEGLSFGADSKEGLMAELETRLLRWFVGENIL